jgi:hypothetical protein
VTLFVTFVISNTKRNFNLDVLELTDVAIYAPRRVIPTQKTESMVALSQ